MFKSRMITISLVVLLLGVVEEVVAEIQVRMEVETPQQNRTYPLLL